MAKKPESRLQRRCRKAIEEAFPGCFVFKQWGGPFIRSGLPDLIGCVHGLFFGIEIKNPGEVPETPQQEILDDIATAGGISGYATSPEEAVSIIRAALSKAKDRVRSSAPRKDLRPVRGARFR